jgi:hypothetical protein
VWSVYKTGNKKLLISNWDETSLWCYWRVLSNVSCIRYCVIMSGTDTINHPSSCGSSLQNRIWILLILTYLHWCWHDLQHWVSYSVTLNHGMNY